jgi:hypothetical protein
MSARREEEEKVERDRTMEVRKVLVTGGTGTQACFPLLADTPPRRAVARAYGVYLEREESSSRALFVIDGQGTIHWSRVYPGLVNPGVDGILGALESMGSIEEQRSGKPTRALRPGTVVARRGHRARPTGGNLHPSDLPFGGRRSTWTILPENPAPGWFLGVRLGPDGQPNPSDSQRTVGCGVAVIRLCLERSDRGNLARNLKIEGSSPRSSA